MFCHPPFPDNRKYLLLLYAALFIPQLLFVFMASLFVYLIRMHIDLVTVKL